MTRSKKIHVGTSGFSYPQWKGSFYPDDIKPEAMLTHYGRHFDSVEINNTFYRMPRKRVLEGWCQQVPDDFRFVIKASRRITHQNRLKNAEDNIRYLFDQLVALGERLGPVFFQLPRTLKCDVSRLDRFLSVLPSESSVCFEFQNPTWEDPEVDACLSRHGAVRCLADREDGPAEPNPRLPTTGPFGYIRLRRDHYEDAALAAWARTVVNTYDTAYVFFMHEDEGEAPELARRFRAHVDEARSG